MLAGRAARLEAAREEESEEDADNGGGFWYVGCTDGGDLLVLPSIPQADKRSRGSAQSILRRTSFLKLEISAFLSPPDACASSTNEQYGMSSRPRQRRIDENAKPSFRRRPQAITIRPALGTPWKRRAS